jgi:hypothetical protein
MPTPTRTAEGIRRHGFRKWYERQLVESHLFLVTAVLALVATASGFELLSIRETASDAAFAAAVVVAGAALAWFSWRRYAALMTLAEYVGHQAQCPGCRRHGFRALPPGEGEARGRPDALVASCRRCGHRWPIDTGA